MKSQVYKASIVGILLFILVSHLFAERAQFDQYGNTPAYVKQGGSIIPGYSNMNFDNTRDEWENMGPWGGDVYSIAMSTESQDTIYAACGVPYISTDAGQNWVIWESLANLSFTIKVITVAQNGVIYAGGDANDGLFKSTNSGETWSHINNFPILLRVVTAIEVDPLDPDIIYVGMSSNSAATDWQQIAKTTDGCSNWTILDTFAFGVVAGVTDIAIDPGNSQNIIVSGIGGISGGDVIFTSDAGINWQNISSGLPTDFPFNDIEISESDVYLSGGQLFGSQFVGIYKSQMGIFSWQNISLDFPLPVVNKVLVSPANSLLIYAATEGDGLYTSEDAGVTWDYTSNGADNFSIFDLILNPNNLQELFIGCKSMAVYKSVDSGANFNSSNHGIAKLWVNDIAVDPSNPNNIIVAFEGENSGGCYISYDGGHVWDVVSTLPATRYSAVSFDNLGNIYACSQGPSTVAQEGVYKSGDGGLSWSNTGPNIGPLFETEIRDIEIADTDPNLIFISGNHYGNGGFAATIYRTLDGASSSWSEVYVGPNDRQVRTIKLAANSGNQILYAGYFTYGGTGSFMRSFNQGENWVDINVGVPENCCQTFGLAIDQMNPNVVYAGTGHYSVNYRLMKTDNFGEIWSEVLTTTSRISDILIDPNNNNHIYAAILEEGVMMTGDSGLSWEDISEGLALGAQLSRFSNSFQVGDETKFCVGSYNRSAFINTMDAPLGLLDDSNPIEDNLRSLTNYPNPFNPKTTISFNLTVGDKVELIIFNVRGQRVKELLNDDMKQGTNTVVWDGTDDYGNNISSGVYFFRVTTSDEGHSRKILLMK
ncbi:MAG: FlgD immunoglobulin-like domain containing protein [Candidatus Zophobacter franzmannii]|nr:FlgD immunoglobulin-like domain containing protein [Candidatus Zophobacter franzmannii]